MPAVGGGVRADHAAGAMGREADLLRHLLLRLPFDVQFFGFANQSIVERAVATFDSEHQQWTAIT